MSIQRIPQVLPAITSFEDGVQTPNISGGGAIWSTGAIFIVPLALGGPLVGQRWSLIGISLSGNITFNPPGSSSYGGKLGKVFFGIDPSGKLSPTPTANNILNFFNPQMDSTLTSDFWNPADDPLPPSPLITSGVVPGYFSNSLMPPNPIQLQDGTQPNLVLAIEPSLYCYYNSTSIGNLFGLNFSNFQATLTYDDGL